MLDGRCGGLGRFSLTLDQAVELPRGIRRSLASCCVRFGFCEEARDLLRRIVAEDPSGIYYRLGLVQALLQCGEIDEADHLSRQLLEEFPEKQRVMLARAAVALFLDREDEARQLYSKPEDAYSFWAHLGIAALRRGETHKARDALERALAIYRNKQAKEPDEYSTPAYLWTALAQLGDDPAFARDLDRMREEEETKIKAALARPPRSTRRDRRPALTRPRPPEPEPPPAEPELLPPCAPNPELERRLRDYFGFTSFRPGQQEVIERVLAGRSVLAVMPTGAGKSLCYQLPAMMLDGLTVVVSPLIALMKDQVDGLPSVVQDKATLINSTLEGDEIERRLKNTRAGRYRLVYAAPERLRQAPFLHALKRAGVALLVVDEAHCVSMWGHDFRPDYLFIGRALDYLGQPTVLAMTATANPAMRREICDQFGRQLAVVSTGTYRPNLFLESIALPTEEEKMRAVICLCREIEGPGIVYTRSRQKAEILATLLRRHGVQAHHYHAGMDAEARELMHEEFMDSRYRVMCATVAFGMGVDKPDVRFVIHFSLPSSLEDYYQEAGRAGRDGELSRCILLFTSSDKALATRWMRAEMMYVELPRKCYQLLRELTPDSRFAAVPTDDFVRETGEEDTRVRVAISALERVGLVRRHLDLPTTITVGLTRKGEHSDDAELRQLVADGRLRLGQRISFDALELSRRVSIQPSDIEHRLLDWSDEGLLTYHGSGRVMLLERLAAPRDSRSQLERILDDYSHAQENRAATISHYAESRRCRHGLVADHFGEQRIERCTSCDNCAPRRPREEATSKQARSAPSGLTDAEKRRKILETVRMLEGHVGYTGLVRVLKGSIASGIKRDRCRNFGILAAEPKATVERYVRELLDADYLRRDDGEYRLISLSPKGLAELQGVGN